MASYAYFPQSGLPVFDAYARPAPGARLYFYVGDTTTPLLVYQDPDLTTAHTWPVECDAGGIIPSIYLSLSGSYNVVIRDASDALIRAIPRLGAEQAGESSIQSGKRNYAITTGTGGAYVGAFQPAFIGVDDGTVVRVMAHVACAAGATLDVGDGPRPIRHPAGGAVAAGDIAAGAVAELVRAADAWVLIGGGWRPLRVVMLTYSQTYTAPAAVRSVIVTCVGGGGAGGGVPATSAGQSAAGAGGSGGQIAIGQLTAGFGGGVAVTVGAGGTANIGTNGGNGSPSSFGALVMALGGVGGEYVLTSSYTTTAPGLANSGAYTAPLWGAPGAVGAPGIVMNPGTSQIGGNGAAGYRGFGAGAGSKNGGGGAGGGNGSGGGGAASGASTAARAGGAGGAGLVVIEEYV